MIRVHIERLVLDGLALGPGGADRVRAAVERHLAEKLAGRDLTAGLAGGGAVPAAVGADITVDGTDHALTGQRLAASLASTLSAEGAKAAPPDRSRVSGRSR